MNKKIEKLQANIPADNDWNMADIDKKAAEMGLNRTDFILQAVDLLVNFDKDFLDHIKRYAKDLNIADYLVIQNQIIRLQADREAEYEVMGKTSQKLLTEFAYTTDESGNIKTMTGTELFEMLKEERRRYYQPKQRKENSIGKE